MEIIDIYDQDRKLTGRVHRRGTPWKSGEYGLVVCVWVHDGHGRLLLTRRAKGKSFAGTWENSGGAAKAGEDSLTAIQRELYEETGICAEPEAFEFLDSNRDRFCFYDHYCLKWQGRVEDVVLQPGETDGVKWVTFAQVDGMIRRGEICQIIGRQFYEEEQKLLNRQYAQ